MGENENEDHIIPIEYEDGAFDKNGVKEKCKNIGKKALNQLKQVKGAVQQVKGTDTEDIPLPIVEEVLSNEEELAEVGLDLIRRQSEDSFLANIDLIHPAGMRANHNPDEDQEEEE